MTVSLQSSFVTLILALAAISTPVVVHTPRHSCSHQWAVQSSWLRRLLRLLLKTRRMTLSMTNSVSCGQQCGWAQGGSCDSCQINLFNNIQQGKFEFHPKEWGKISPQAKDLIKKLLVKDAKKRLSAGDVLSHVWLMNNNTTELTTPAKIRKNNSVKELSMFAESAAAVNRVVLQHMSINIWPQGGDTSAEDLQ